MNNREVALTFETVADMLAIRGDSVHRVLAYRRAGENIRELSQDLNQIYAEGKLTQIPGIGSTLAGKIEEMLTTGRLEFYERLAEEIPPSLVELLRVEGVGPKRVKLFHDQMGIKNIKELKEAAEAGRLTNLPGFGKRSQDRILTSIGALEKYGDERLPLGTTWPIAHDILSKIRDLPGVQAAEVAGSIRRMRETTGDIDLLAAADDPEPIMEYFCHMPDVETILGSGSTKTSVHLINGVQVDLRVLPKERWGTLLSYFTGSKAHNVRLRELALKSGLSLNEHSFKPLSGDEDILIDNEFALYEQLGLPYIPPPLREDRGEIEAAYRDELPKLVQLADLKADLHMHSTWSDGKTSILEMARGAKERGLTYIVISDHSASLGITNGLSIERLFLQADEIKEVDDRMGPGFRVFHGTEMEIRADGSMDYPDHILEQLDFVIASLHMSLSQSRSQITKRLLSALENPHVDMIAHPTGRLLVDRPGADLDIEEVINTAAQTGTILEINANPQRLDLKDVHVRRAIELGVTLAINSDAHHPDHMDFLHFGIGTAQRGWATAADVINSRPVEEFSRYVLSRG
ncbi:MAG: DNA polymerase/3'-5' exonuclease PolX [Anaerolineae bacterium]|nr:MAG: DNA polymerase/3'-5' exonuclease PolX [Anaerolineae bacterium]